MTVGGGCQEGFLRTESESEGSLQNGLHHSPDADAVHAAEINRALAEKTGRTRCVGFQQAMVQVTRQDGAGQFRRCAAERDDNWCAECGGDVHGAGVVREKDAAGLQKRHEFAE